MDTPKQIKIWDLPTRIFHWLLVFAFTVAYLTEDDLLTVHVWAGYLTLFLVLFRIIWGFVGNQYARFSNFICSPTESLAYLKEVIRGSGKRYLGHNPAGAAMIVLLLLGLITTVMTGLTVYAADQQLGPLAGLISAQNEKLWEEVHEVAANLTLLLACIHVLGVIFESFIHHENLAKAMWTGLKRKIDE
jgi:cytochrome b